MRLRFDKKWLHPLQRRRNQPTANGLCLCNKRACECAIVLPLGGSHDAVIRVYDAAGNVIEKHEHADEFKEREFFAELKRREVPNRVGSAP